MSEPTDGSASLYVRDGPTDEFAEIHVVFASVEVHAAASGYAGHREDGNGSSDGNHTEMGPAEATAPGHDNGTNALHDAADWRTLWQNESGVDIDLMQARDAQAAFLGEQAVPVGKYSQIRMHVLAAYGVTADGTRHDFDVPSNKVRLVTPFEVEPDLETRIILDLDLDQSIQRQGQRWMLHPVLGSTDVAVVDSAGSGADVHDEGEIVSMS